VADIDHDGMRSARNSQAPLGLRSGHVAGRATPPPPPPAG
jgi:hypothetical protein